MSEEVLIKVEGLGKKFCKDLKKSLKYGVQDVGRSLLGKDLGQELRKKEFWAVNNIDFELKRGECLGLIGHNGAGKSTLLKILNGLIKPDKGSVTIRGRIAALIELGAGFNPILTGRENIYNNAAVLGFTKKEIDEKLEDIIAFSEIGEFIDSPVQNYSSGMKVRLGFSVAAQMEPDVLIIDEVLAVGDLGFRLKCLNRIGELISKSAVIFVTHSMPQISRICTKCILFNKGEIVVDSNDIGYVISKYYNMFSNESESIIGKENIDILSFNVFCNKEKLEFSSIFRQGEKLLIDVSLNVKRESKTISVKIFFINADMRNVWDIPSELFDKKFKVEEGKATFSLETPPVYLNAGKYAVSLIVQDGETDERLYRHDNIIEVVVESSYQSWSDMVGAATWIDKN